MIKFCNILKFLFNTDSFEFYSVLIVSTKNQIRSSVKLSEREQSDLIITPINCSACVNSAYLKRN